jgi:hypothetical protein
MIHLLGVVAVLLRLKARYLTVPLGIGSAIGLSLAIAASATAQTGEASMPLSIIPAVSLVAIIGGAISMGMLFNRVKQLEKDQIATAALDEMLRERTHDLGNSIMALTGKVDHLATLLETMRP